MVNQRLNNQTKYYHIKYHWFWEHVKSGLLEVCDCDTKLMRADCMTKGQPRETFERNRYLNQGW